MKEGIGMTKKRFTWEYSHNDSTGEIIDWIRNECLMTDYLQKYELEEWCQELNKIVDENNQLRKENGQLKKDLKKKFVPFTKADGDYTAVNTEEFIKILNENEQLKQEVENLHEQLTHFLGDSDD